MTGLPSAPPPDAQLPVFRAPMRSRDDRVPPDASIARALAHGVCGIGGVQSPPPPRLDVAIAREHALRGERAGRRLARFAAAPCRAFVWTRDARGELRLGRLVGAWRYDAATAAAAADLVHIRDCDWLAEPVAFAAAPAAVRTAFARGGRNWQRIRRPETGPLTAAVWAAHRPADADVKSLAAPPLPP